MKVLERYATQPGNCRSRKPARLIWMYTLGKSRQKIIADLRISEETLEKHFACWIVEGVSGLTKAYHPELTFKKIADSILKEKK